MEEGGEERGEEEACREITFSPFLVHFHQPPLDQYHFVFLPFSAFSAFCMQNPLLLAQLVGTFGCCTLLLALSLPLC